MTRIFKPLLGIGLGVALAVAAASSAPFVTESRANTPPAGPSSLDIKYDLSISIIGLGYVDVKSRINGAEYEARSTLDTKGIVNIFWQAHIEAQSNGRIHPRGMQPALYDSRSTRRSGRQQMTVTYGPNGPVHVVAVPARPRQEQKYPVTEEQRRGTVDPLSAMVFVASGLTARSGESVRHDCTRL